MPKVRALMTRSPLRDSGNEKRSEEARRSAAPRAPFFARQIARLEFTHRVHIAGGESGGNDQRITNQPPRRIRDGRLVIIDSSIALRDTRYYNYTLFGGRSEDFS